MRMSNKKGSKLIKQIKEELKVQNNTYWNCPPYIQFLNESPNVFDQPLNPLQIKMTEIYTQQLFLKKSWFFTYPSQLRAKELISHIDLFVKTLKERIKIAQSHDKKLLVILAEEHFTNHAYLFEILFITVLKSFKFNSLLVERNPEEINDTLTQKDPLLAPDLFAYRVLKMKLHGIDPNYDSNNFQKRDEGIAREVVKYSNENQVLIIGKLHFKPLIARSSIKKKFEFLAIDLKQKKNKYDAQIQKEFNLVKTKWSQTSLLEDNQNYNLEQDKAYDLNTSLETIIESFSINELYNIYFNVLPKLLDLKTKEYSEEFNADLNKRDEKCHYYKDIVEKAPEYATTLHAGSHESYHSEL